MPKPLEEKKRQKILLMALVIVVAITVFYLYSNYQKRPVVEESIPATGEPIAGLSVIGEGLKDIKLDLSVLDDPLFKSLKSHGVLPVTAGETGLENPFLPY